VAAQAERLLTMAGIARKSVLLRGYRMGTEPITRVDVARPQTSVVTGRTFADRVTSLAATRIIAGNVAMPKEPIIAMFERGGAAAGLQQLSLESGAHPRALRFVAQGAFGTRSSIETTTARVATDTGWFGGQSFGTDGIRQTVDPTVALRATNLALRVSTMRIA
jgi:hypothetical protein